MFDFTLTMPRLSPPRSPAPATLLLANAAVRLMHTLVLGKTGSGKSTLLRAICEDDAHAGRGFLLVDPHGDLAQAVVRDLPRKRKNDLVLLDATDPGSSMSLDPFRNVAPEVRSLVTANLLATMRKIWGAELFGPRTEHVLRHAFLALLEVRGATLADARAMLTDDRRRRTLLAQVKDPDVLSFWTVEFPGYGRLLPEVTAPILNKLGALLASSTVRAFLAKGRRVLDARKLIDRSAIVVASLPKGRIGEDATLLLGGLLLGAFQHAALGRADMAAEDRSPFSMIVDEVGSFATPPLLGLVAEARKYGVGLVVASQSLLVLEPPVRGALLGNVGTLITFRVGADDAELVSRELVHDIAAEHLQRLAVGEHVVRIGAGRAVLVPPIS